MMRTFLLLAMLLAALPAPSGAFDGPLQVRNQFPLSLGVSPPYLESAGTRDAFSASLHYSSIYLVRTSATWTVEMDLETLELDLRLKKRIGARSEAGIEVPVIRPSGGFLDHPLEAWHNALGAGDYGRHERPANSFLYSVVHDGAPVIQGVNDRTGFGDVRLTWKQVISASTDTVSVLATVELPTGDARTGYGNGSVDAGLALLADLDWGPAYRAHVNLGVVAPGDLKGFQTVRLNPFAYGGIAVEAAWWDRFSALVQLMVQQSPFPKMKIRKVDWPGVLLTFGGRWYYSERGSIELSLTEDPDTASAPDFIVQTAWTHRF